MKTKQSVVFAALLAVSAMASSQVAMAGDPFDDDFGGRLAAELTPGEPSSVDSRPSSEPEMERILSFSRFNVLTGGFVAIDLKFFELKIEPYLELRFQRKRGR